MSRDGRWAHFAVLFGERFTMAVACNRLRCAQFLMVPDEIVGPDDRRHDGTITLTLIQAAVSAFAFVDISLFCSQYRHIPLFFYNKPLNI